MGVDLDLSRAMMAGVVDWLYRSHDAIEAALADPGFCAAVDLSTRMIATALFKGGHILIAGNGGSAALAQHFAAELVGRFTCERAALAAVALGSDVATLTALANDYGYERAFERQFSALAAHDSVLVAISTSGKSPNILRAAESAKVYGVPVIAMTGKPGDPLRERANAAIVAPVAETALVQQVHLAAVHAICGLVEQLVIRSKPGFAANLHPAGQT